MQKQGICDGNGVRKMYMTGNFGIGWYEESIPTLINSSVEDAISH